MAWEVFPLALLLGGVTAVARGWLWTSAPAGAAMSQAAIEHRALALAERWPELLAEALIAALVSALVLTHAAATRRALPTLIGLTVTALAVGAYVTGFPEDRPGIRGDTLGAAAGITMLGFGLSRLPFRGVAALVFGVLVGFGLPYLHAYSVKAQQPGMTIRRVIVDLVASLDDLDVRTERTGAAVTRGVITPAVDQRTDTGDKPAILMAPPAAVEFVVPHDADGSRLIAAAGMDQASITHFGDLASIPVEYRVTVDGTEAWSQVVEHRPMAPGTFDTEPMRWRHVEDANGPGVPLLAGQTVRLETSFVTSSMPDGFDTDTIDAKALKLGFGGVMLRREERRPRAIPTPTAPNVVFIVVDTLRRDRIGLYGYGKQTTPNLDRFAKSALVFEDAYTTSSWTWPSTASLLTSLPPDAHGVKSSDACTLSQGLVTIAEALQDRGYTTAAFVGNPIIEPNRYFDQGFESFDVEVPNFRMSDEFVPDALEWLDEHSPLRFFLYLHIVDPHTPHRPHPAEAARLELRSPPAGWPERGLDGIYRRDTPSDEIKQYANDLYDASVATADRWIGAVLAKLEALELSESTIVCITSDHGEELFDRGFRGHGHNVYAELVRAPLLIRAPGLNPGRRRGVVSNRHLPTTIAALTDTALPGHGLMLDLTKDAPPDEALFETTKGYREGSAHRQLFGLRRGTQTTIWWHSDRDPKSVGIGDIEHYDDVSDPIQANDLVKVATDRARESVERMLKKVEAARAAKPDGVVGVGAGGRNTLVQIGYAGNDDD